VRTAKAWGSEGATIQRYKGLGEMNPDQLRATTLDPSVRVLRQITLRDVEDAEQRVSTLMGDDPENRRVFVVENSDLAQVDA
jgi:DNA gyrase subunit B